MEPENYGTSGNSSMLREEAESQLEHVLQPSWRSSLDDRMRTHVAFAEHYAQHFAHGAPGHLDLLTIAKLASLLDRPHL